jgi:hypothetical protein
MAVTLGLHVKQDEGKIIATEIKFMREWHAIVVWIIKTN